MNRLKEMLQGESQSEKPGYGGGLRSWVTTRKKRVVGVLEEEYPREKRRRSNYILRHKKVKEALKK